MTSSASSPAARAMICCAVPKAATASMAAAATTCSTASTATTACGAAAAPAGQPTATRRMAGGGMGDATDFDTLYGGRGDDDLIGGAGSNDLVAWSRDPQPGSDTFGVFVNPANPNGALFDDNPTGTLIYEDTGLDRMLGSSHDDRLFGGSGVAFMYGNGGDDTLYRADGTTFESLDGGLAGDEWKQYAKESGKVWYVSATNADDVITVDYVTEPGLLRGHHLITRLTNNNGNFSFAAQVRLDFGALDAGGDPVWDASDAAARLDELEQRGGQQNSANPNTTLEPGGAPTNFHQLTSDQLLDGLLPGEGDFDVILIDALDGDDQLNVGPTVQKTVWADMGRGNDRAVISAGNAILVDKTEFIGRNDTAASAYRLAADPLEASTTFSGLTIDNPS